MVENKSGGGTFVRAERIRSRIPGLVVLAVCAVCSWLVGSVAPGLSPLLVAITVGAGLSNLVGVPAWARDGVASHDMLLSAAIVLMGGTLSIDAIGQNGVRVLALVVGAIAFTVAFVEIVSRSLLDLDSELSSLLAAGVGICGVSAVVAVAGCIRAREDQIVYATATILLFDAVTLVAYPVVGELLAVPAQTFGVWAGVSMFSTGPVVAAGFTHSEAAGEWATLTKLTRNAFIGFVALGYAVYYVRIRDRAVGDESGWTGVQRVWDRFPKFVLGFVVLAVLASAEAFSSAQVRTLERAYEWLFLLAFVGLGTDLSVSEFRQTGVTPVLVVFAALCTVSALSFVVLTVAFG